MAAKKKAKKKKRATTARTRKATPKKSVKRASARKTAQKKVARKKTAPKKTVRRTTLSASPALSRVRPRLKTPSADEDSQGLSTVERADSESVSELLEEGNTFEAGVVRGVEEADDADERGVRTREFPEDDVPEEYLDKD